ncbi:fused uroporphyrinogen-III synthase HemD/membrane protein HemX [Pararobbsia alpina]|uniref:fused uroporphyrinogen-III synthase HemD/membrane protein HemX n=1 Tax=Pararobbsia alpina TaxID=621374 RepID=UPI0039A5FDC7
MSDTPDTSSSSTARAVRAAGPTRVILTRPAGQSAALAASLRENGCEAVEFPLIAIAPAQDPAPLDAALGRVGDCALVVFVSPNAIDQAFARFKGVWPEHVPVAVVGPGSIAALSHHGIAAPGYRVIAPDGAAVQARALTGGPETSRPGPFATPGSSSTTASPTVPVAAATPQPDAGTTPTRSEAQRAAAARAVSSDSFFAPPPDPVTVDAAAAATAEGSTVSASTDTPVDPDSVRFDSETLIAALERELGLASLAGRRVLLVRGNGGRELVADTLRERGAEVEPVVAYQRSVPVPDPAALTQVRRWLTEQHPERDPVWVVTSSEGVRNLSTLAEIHFDAREQAALHRARFVVPHPRIAESARNGGFGTVTISGAGDAALIRAILALDAGVEGDAKARVEDPALNATTAAQASQNSRGDAPQPETPRADVHAGPSVNSATGDRASTDPSPRTGATPAASSTPRGASSSMTDSKDTLTPTPMPPTRFSASGADRPAPSGRQRGRLLLAWLALILAVAAGVGAYALNRKLDRMERALNDRQQTSERTAAASTQESTRAFEFAQQTDRRLSQIEGKLADAQGQQQALQNMYQDLARDRTQWTLSEIEQIVANASQQLQLTGNVQLALFALQNADARLSQTEGAQILAIRKAFAQDIDKLKATPNVDIAGLAIKLDDAIARIDSLPLAGEGPVPQADSASSSAAASTDTSSAASATAGATGGNAFSNAVKRFDAFWGEFGTRLLHQLSGVVQVRRIDNADAMLVAPDQGQYVRANLRLRLLSARLSLLSRDQKTMDSDLDAANAAIAHYFDPNAPATRTERDLIAQVRQASTAVELPNLNASLDAIHQYKSGD